jgi:hypothetical protein
MSAGKSRASGLSVGKNSTNAKPVLLILPVRLEIVFVLCCQDRQITFFQSFGPKLAIHRRYTERRFLCIPYCSLQGITVRPVPCNYYVIRPNIVHGANAGSNPAGDAKPFQEVTSETACLSRYTENTLSFGRIIPHNLALGCPLVRTESLGVSSSVILDVECRNSSCTTFTSSPLLFRIEENVWRNVCHDMGKLPRSFWPASSGVRASP